jgi:ATP-dependent helicase/DNAse subunit B
MPISLIVGPPNSGRAGEILRRVDAASASEPVLVVPTGDDVAHFERELCDRGANAIGSSVTTLIPLADEIARAGAAAVAPPLTVPQRQALVRAAIQRTPLQRLRRSASRPGFAAALDTLIAELQSALMSTADFAALIAELGEADYERELCALYASYVQLRETAGRGDAGTLIEGAIRALRADPHCFGGRPVFVYGFDDFTRAQQELIAALAGASEITVAVTYADHRAMVARATLLTILRDELGGEVVAEVPFEEDYTPRATLRHLDLNLFEADAGTVEQDEGIVLMECAGARGEAEAIGLEIARLLADGAAPDDVVVVVRSPREAGPLLASVLRDLGIPVALEAAVPLAGTCVGESLLALCRAASDERNVDDLLAHLRSDAALSRSAVDWVERRIRRGDARTVAEATESWSKPPRHLARVQAAANSGDRLQALARGARELAEAPHRGEAPLAGSAGLRESSSAVPFVPLELRAGVAAAELLGELAEVGRLPGCEQPDLAGASEALESASVPAWRGPTSGRVRIMSPYRVRAGRARFLFCAALQDGAFPTAAPPDPLLPDERRAALGSRDLRRAEQADEERYLFHACVSRPTERLYLSWRSCDEDGGALARSPYIDEVLDLIAPDPETAEEALKVTRGLERVVPAPDEAPTVRALGRSLALAAPRAPTDALARVGMNGDRAAEVAALFEGLPDPEELPGPLRAPRLLAALRERTVLSAGALENWLECPYRWFVEHELAPQRLEPEGDPLWLGGLVHQALQDLYRDPPGSDSIARPGDVGRWKKRFSELLFAHATQRAAAPPTPGRRAALERARVQVEAFLDAEARSDTELRPRPDLVERGFGFPEDEGEPTEVLQLGEIALHGRIDRIDLASDERSAVVRDYKTGKSVAGARTFADTGTLQIQLYMLVAERVLGLEPIAGLYQPLGATRSKDRRPRGIAVRGDERIAGLDPVNTDLCDREQLDEALRAAESRAIEAARDMRAGKIGRRPLGGKCPEYCTFQPICRLERAIGAVGDENGDDDEG